MTRPLINAVIALALLAYPFTMYFAASRVAPKRLLAGVLILLALRAAFRAWRAPARRWRWLALTVALLLGAVAALFSRGVSLAHVQLYPVVIDAVFFLVFFLSLFTRQPLVERIVRARGDALDAQGVCYTRRVTWAWSAVLLANTLIALYTTLYASLAVWTLWNGLLSYLLIGVTYATEYLVRPYLRENYTRDDKISFRLFRGKGRS